MEQIVISLVITNSHLLESQSNIIAPGKDAIVHMQSIRSILMPNDVRFPVEKCTIHESGGTGLPIPVDFHYGAIAVIANAIDEVNIVLPEFITAVPAIVSEAAI